MDSIYNDEQIFEIVIDHIGIKGDGVARLPDGRTVFVAGALAGERVRARITAERPEGVAATLVENITTAPQRRNPPCAYFGSCGGCVLQHMNDKSYTSFKSQRVKEALARFGVIPRRSGEPQISPPGSRRRAVLSARCDESGTTVLGFNERASHKLVAVEACIVMHPVLVAVLPPLRAALPALMKPGESYDVALTLGAGDTVDLLITVLGRPGRMCEKAGKVTLRALAAAAGISRIAWQQRRDLAPEILHDDGAFAVQFADFRVVAAPGAFLQATAAGEAALTSFAATAIPARGSVADLYAGCGTFSFTMLSAGCAVDAFEGDAAAITAMQAAACPDTRLRAVRRDLAKEPLSFQELRGYDAVIVDPPRLGAQKQMAEIARSPVKRVVSISCNPDSFARDGAILVQAGFTADRLEIIDQFLWSPHLEIAALFTRR